MGTINEAVGFAFKGNRIEVRSHELDALQNLSITINDQSHSFNGHDLKVAHTCVKIMWNDNDSALTLRAPDFVLKVYFRQGYSWHINRPFLDIEIDTPINRNRALGGIIGVTADPDLTSVHDEKRYTETSLFSAVSVTNKYIAGAVPCKGGQTVQSKRGMHTRSNCPAPPSTVTTQAPTVPASTPPPTSLPTTGPTHTYLGCYTALRYFTSQSGSTNIADDTFPQTVAVAIGDTCANACAAHTYFAVFKTECFCGNTLPNPGNIAPNPEQCQNEEGGSTIDQGNIKFQYSYSVFQKVGA